MVSAIHLELATPAGLVVDEDVDEVVAPGLKGQFGARPGHQPFLVELTPGLLGYVQSGKTTWYAISGGTAEVRHDRVIVLADTCEPGTELDLERAEEAGTRANQRLKDFARDAAIDADRALAALARANARIDAAGRVR